MNETIATRSLFEEYIQIRVGPYRVELWTKPRPNHPRGYLLLTPQEAKIFAETLLALLEA